MNFLYSFVIFNIIWISYICPQKQEYALHTPYSLSQKSCNDLQSYLSTLATLNIKEISKALLYQFPWIKTTTIKQLKPHHFSVTITLLEPFCAIQNISYVTTNGIIFSHEILRNEIYEKLPTLRYESPYCPTDLGHQIAALSQNLFDSYTIIWKNKNEIILIDKEQECFPIITSLSKKITSQIAHYCHYIHKKFNESYTNKKKKKYSLDIRFDKQIVLRPQENIKYEKSSSS